MRQASNFNLSRELIRNTSQNKKERSYMYLSFGFSRLFVFFSLLSQAFVQQGAARDPLLEPFRDSGDKCAVLLAKELLDLGRDEDEMLELIFGVWVEMMLYAADHCARDSHARQLSNGGEFITIVWLLVHHRMYIARYNKFINMLNSRHPGSNNPNV